MKQVSCNESIRFNILKIFEEAKGVMSLDDVCQQLKRRNVKTTRRSVANRLHEMHGLGLIRRAYQGVYMPGVNHEAGR